MDMRTSALGLAFASTTLCMNVASANFYQSNSGSTHIQEVLTNIGNRSGSPFSVKIEDDIQNSRIQTIKKVFDFTNEEVSKVIGVTRKTLDNWEKNGIKKDKDKTRVLELFIISKDWEYNRLPASNEILTTPIVDEKSVFQLLQESELNKEKIIFAGQSLAHQSLKLEEDLF